MPSSRTGMHAIDTFLIYLNIALSMSTILIYKFKDSFDAANIFHTIRWSGTVYILSVRRVRDLRRRVDRKNADVNSLVQQLHAGLRVSIGDKHEWV